jgi:hypothetical protein
MIQLITALTLGASVPRVAVDSHIPGDDALDLGLLKRLADRHRALPRQIWHSTCLCAGSAACSSLRPRELDRKRRIAA